MRTRSKILLAGLGAAVVLSMALTSASANRLSVTNKNFRLLWSSLELHSAAGVLLCPVTMEGSFHSQTIRKVVGALIGYVSRASVRGQQCTGVEEPGTATIAQESLPWHLRYRGFSGTLPRITLLFVGLINAKFQVNQGGFTCTAQTSTANPGVGAVHVEPTTGALSSLDPDESAQIPLRGSFFCEIGGNGTFSGRATVRLLGTNQLIFIRLI